MTGLFHFGHGFGVDETTLVVIFTYSKLLSVFDDGKLQLSLFDFFVRIQKFPVFSLTQLSYRCFGHKIGIIINLATKLKRKLVIKDVKHF